MRAIGLMSGTSMDGIDAVILDTDGETQIKRLGEVSLAYDNDFKIALKAQSRYHIQNDVIRKSTALHAVAIQQLLKKTGFTPKEIDLIGYHGQAIYHNPSEKISLQIGDPQWLANQFGIPVVFDFRSNDIAHGGQGAPLAPLYHQALMRQKKLDNLAIINCGGIANISVLSNDKIIAGFDTGPGNVLLDQFVRNWTNDQHFFDKDGEFAKKGKTDSEFLNILFDKTAPHYYLKSPPKSLDIHDIIFIDDIKKRFPNDHIQHLYDGCATLAVFTAFTITNSVVDMPKNVVICGGGAKNPAILSALRDFLPHSTVKTADDMGWSTTYMEAELFAWLAVRSMKKLPLSVPETTGVKEPMTGGKCFYPVV